LLALVGVEKRYGRVPALTGLTLNVGPGDVYGFLGRNGAGKSTALRIVMGITRADGGRVELFGAPARPGDVGPRRRIGYVAQEQHFYEWMTPARLGEFVGAFYPTWDPVRYQKLRQSFDIPERKIGTFSGGTKVKLALALALAHRPELLVLDEPTAGLDPVARREFADIVRELARGGQHATLFSSHLIDEVEAVANRVGIVEQGRMRFEGPLGDLSQRVRTLALTSTELQALDGPLAIPRILAELPVRLLRSRVRDEAVEFVLWLDDVEAFAQVSERLPRARFIELSLEDCFIELVRTDVGTAVAEAQPSDSVARIEP
jgi:ABC-2 type transport system ATP-binding protein